LYDYEAVTEEEFSVTFNEIVRIIEESNTEWVYASNLDNTKTGYLPRSYIEYLPPPSTTQDSQENPNTDRSNVPLSKSLQYLYMQQNKNFNKKVVIKMSKKKPHRPDTATLPKQKRKTPEKALPPPPGTR